MKHSSVVVRAFDGSRKSVIGEVDLPVTIGPQVFQITFQVMDIRAAYSCLLGRPWIHEAGAVTSTLHQKLKFIKDGKLVTVGGEEAFMVSHLSAYPFISAGDSEGTSFQGLTMEEEDTKKSAAPMASFKDAQEVVKNGPSAKWGKLLSLTDNKHKKGLGFSPSAEDAGIKAAKEPGKVAFHSAGVIHIPPEANAILEDKPGQAAPNFVTPGGACQNWTAIDVPSVFHDSK